MTLIVRIGKREKQQDLLIDNCDAALLVHTWAPQNPNKGKLIYAQGATKGKDGKYTTILLHRLVAASILGRPLTRAEVVDHINGNGLDNRRKNLRVCTFAENLRNQKKKDGCLSPYKGVTWNKRSNKWQASIGANGTDYYLGVYDLPEDAAKAYNRAARRYHGKFARLNDMEHIKPVERVLTDEDTQPIIIPFGWPYDVRKNQPT